MMTKRTFKSPFFALCAGLGLALAGGIGWAQQSQVSAASPAAPPAVRRSCAG